MTLSLVEKPKEHYLNSFLIALLLSSLFFIPFLIKDHGYFFFYGDFNVQQIPFYKLAHEAVKSGDFYWSWYTDLGANFIGSYSFYLLGSPFFWLTLPFPTSFVPYLMAPLLCLKFATASLTAYSYITRFVKNKYYALLGGLLYAFSGFSIYNIFFNHFHESIAFFPLLLIGLEKAMLEDKKGFFAFAVFINALVNYFFFVGQVVFLIIYFVARVKTGGFKLTLKKFAFLGFESVIGFCLTGILMLPSVLAILSNPRVDNFSMGWGSLLYHDVQRYPMIMQSFFFPPELPPQPNFFPDSGVKWSSVAGWMPFIGMTFVISFLANKKKHFLKNIIYTCILFAMVPFLNSAFYAFNNSYYGRWFYMPVLMMALTTAISLEDESIDHAKGMRINSNIIIIFTLLLGLFPSQRDGKTVLGLADKPDRFWAYCAITLICAVGVMLIYKYFYYDKEKFVKFLIIATSVVIVGYPIYYLSMGKSYSYTTDYIINTALDARDNFDLPKTDDTKDQFYRVDVFKGMDNQAMFWHMPNIQTFHSIVPGSIMEFYPSIGVTRDVGSRPDESHVGLRSLTSVKFLFARADDYNQNVIIDTNATDPPMVGFTYLGFQNGFHIFENNNYIPMGFTYDLYMKESTFDSLEVSQRENSMLTAIVLDEDQEFRYGNLLTEADFTTLHSVTNFDIPAVADARSSNSAYYFSHDNHGFTAKIKTTKPNLVFFSVPYEDGWTATVNGEPVQVEEVNVGFMAVAVNAGESEIRFTYTTPGLYYGILISCLSMVVFMSYLLINRFLAYNKIKIMKTNPNPNLILPALNGDIYDDDEEDDEIIHSKDAELEVNNVDPKYQTVIEDMPDGEFHEGHPNSVDKSQRLNNKTRTIINDIIESMDGLRHLDKNSYKDPTEEEDFDEDEEDEDVEN